MQIILNDDDDGVVEKYDTEAFINLAGVGNSEGDDEQLINPTRDLSERLSAFSCDLLLSSSLVVVVDGVVDHG